MPKPAIKITAIEFENLRGYSQTRLSLDKQFISVIGDNNQGKSSVLLLLDFLINKGDEALFKGGRTLTDEESEILIPSNNAKHQARRLTLTLHFEDPKQAASYFRSGEKPILRLSVKKKNKTVRLNIGTPHRNESSDLKAINLLKHLREQIKCCIIPANRDSNSEWFNSLLTTEIERRLNAEFHHDKQAGTTRNYRDAREVKNTLNELALNILSGLSKDLLKDISGAMVKEGEIKCSVKNTDLSKWLAKAAVLKLTTGEHDENFVSSRHVGNGLQSTLGVVLGLLCAKQHGSTQQIIAIEEPETFLHPSAQRLVSAMLRRHTSDSVTILITTHSPIFLEEARYEEIVIAKNRKYYEPTAKHGRRRLINTHLMNAANAETFFADCVLFVEGAGDKALFDALFRRLRGLKGGERLWNLSIQVVGGKERFAPWINLMRGYGAPGQRPIKWFSLFDSDACDDGSIRRTLTESGYTPISPHLDGCIAQVKTVGLTDPGRRYMATDRLNKSEISKFKMGFFSADLEWAMCNAGPASGHVSLDILNRLLKERGIPRYTSLHDVARKLGSKIGTGKAVNKPLKDAQIRFEYGKHIPFGSLSFELEQVLYRILVKLLRKTSLVRDLLQNAKLINPQM